jgi:hypothetical protein
MAVSTNNVVTHGLSGKVGDLIVFKQQNGKTVVARVPKKSSTPTSAAQLSVNERFKLASKYAQQAILNPALKQKYAGFAKSNQSVFNVAFADFFSPPVLSDVSGVYNGNVGVNLSIKAIDNYEVKAVKLQIYLADDTLVEEGNALLQVDGVSWKYTCTINNSDLLGNKLIWTAEDLAGNNTQLTIMV